MISCSAHGNILSINFDSVMIMILKKQDSKSCSQLLLYLQGRLYIKKARWFRGFYLCSCVYELARVKLSLTLCVISSAEFDYHMGNIIYFDL